MGHVVTTTSTATHSSGRRTIRTLAPQRAMVALEAVVTGMLLTHKVTLPEAEPSSILATLVATPQNSHPITKGEAVQVVEAAGEGVQWEREAFKELCLWFRFPPQLETWRRW